MYPSFVTNEALEGPLSQNPQMNDDFIERSFLKWSPETFHELSALKQQVVLTVLMLIRRIAPYLDREMRYKLIRLSLGDEDLEYQFLKRRRVEAAIEAECLEERENCRTRMFNRINNDEESDE